MLQARAFMKADFNAIGSKRILGKTRCLDRYHRVGSAMDKHHRRTGLDFSTKRLFAKQCTGKADNAGNFIITSGGSLQGHHRSLRKANQCDFVRRHAMGFHDVIDEVIDIGRTFAGTFGHGSKGTRHGFRCTTQEFGIIFGQTEPLASER